MAKIEIIYKNELAHIKDAIKNSRNPYHTFTLSTINGEQPESRTIVLRGLDVDPLKIYFNADKVVQFGWKKEAVPVILEKRSIIARLFDFLFN